MDKRSSEPANSLLTETDNRTVTRRRLLKRALAIGSGAGLAAIEPRLVHGAEDKIDLRESKMSENKPGYFAYVGSRTSRERNARGEGISVYRIDPTNAKWTLIQLAKDLVNPSFLAFDNQRG
jgi:6-phosphogluconolactonase